MRLDDPQRSLVPSGVGPASSVVGGASITIAWRLLDRGLALVSTPILARLLTPDDFGLIVLASVAAGLVAVFLELGVNAALIQQRSPTAEHYDAAWTLRIIQAVLGGLIIFSISWPAAVYFGDPRLVAVIQIVSVTTALAGLENIGIVLLQKNLQFRREMRYFLSRRLLSLLITISLAFWLRTYWALVIGALIGQIVSVVLSYLLQPFRPRFGLAKIRDILSFSQWVVVRGIGGYIAGSLPSLLLGRSAGRPEVGIYGAARDLSNIAGTEILAPLARVLYPTFVDARDSREEFKRSLSLALSVQFMITVPASVGLALVSEEFVAVLLGPNWSGAAPVLAFLALSNVFGVYTHTGGYALMAIGQIRLQAIIMWIDAAVFALLAATLLAEITPAAVAELRLLVATGIALLYAYQLNRRPIKLSWRLLLGSVARPILASIVMALCLTAFGPYAPTNALAALALKVVLGAAVYIAASAILWSLSGRRAGAESYLIGKAREALSSWRTRGSQQRASD